jgi:hypothetical protein
MPIITELSLQILNQEPTKTCNFKTANWEKYYKTLETALKHIPRPKPLVTTTQIDSVVNTLDGTVKEVINEVIPLTQVTQWSKHWWTSDLTKMRKDRFRVTKLAWKYRALEQHPIHVQARLMDKEYKEAIFRTKRDHWEDWLKTANPSNIQQVNKYTKTYSQHSTIIPSLKIHNPEGLINQDIMTTNENKAREQCKTYYIILNSYIQGNSSTQPLPQNLEGRRSHCNEKIRKKNL